MTKLELFKRNLSIDYTRTKEGVDYAFEKIGEVLYIYFQHSNGTIDWINNLRFKKKAHKMAPWKVHGGFLDCFNAVKDIIKERAVKAKQIVIVGYSHGAALALLCHEYIWLEFKVIRDNLKGYGFGCPRVVGRFFRSRQMKKRWENFEIIRNGRDIVTRLPPKIFRFTHVKRPLQIGDRRRWSAIDSHRAENYIVSLGEGRG